MVEHRLPCGVHGLWHQVKAVNQQIIKVIAFELGESIIILVTKMLRVLFLVDSELQLVHVIVMSVLVRGARAEVAVG